MERAQPLRPEQHGPSPQAGGRDQQRVIDEAPETGGVLEQAATAKHQGIATAQG